MLVGKVIHGDGLGRKYGYPTANLSLPKKKLHLSAGVYAVKAILNNQEFKGAMAINPALQKVEVFLLNYTGSDFYDQVLKVDPIQKISEMEKFDSTKELINKIQDDLLKIKKFFNQ